MKYCSYLTVAAVFLGLGVAGDVNSADVGSPGVKVRVSKFSADWRFHLGDVAGAEKPEFDDSKWRTVDVPHDWSIEGPFDRKSPAGFGGGYLNGGTGWYRKTFTAPTRDAQQRVLLQFDGVYMDSDVWINGHHLGNHPYGYTGFEYDLTPHLKLGNKEQNVLAVRVNVQQPCSRWYSGAGIFRGFLSRVVPPVHIVTNGVYVTTPEVSDQQATVRIRTRVRNDGKAAAKVELLTQINDGMLQDDSVTHEIAAGAEFEFDQTLKIANPKRWSLEKPRLYSVFSGLSANGEPVHMAKTPFGIRTIRFTADKGFFLNDKHVPIRGVCNHHDLGCLGAAAYPAAIQRQLAILKGMGCNAIRTSHNPPDPKLLDLCDQMGLLVMDEAFDEWKRNKTKNGYGRFFDEWSEKDLVSMIHRDRNHPSIILWSLGNEIPEQREKNGRAMAKRLADICRREDPTRPVTTGCSDPTGGMNSGFAKEMDVFGINYNIGDYQKFRGTVMVASETASALSTRGEYNLVLDKDGKPSVKLRHKNQCTSYDLDRPDWGCTAETSLLALKNAPWVAGEFVWTGFDYLGEPTPYQWPSRSSYFGILDTCGFPKDRYYLYQSQWTKRPVCHLLPHWNWEGFEGKEIPVWCFTNADSVELFLNGKSQSVRTAKDLKKLHFEWSVPYEPGVLKAVARREGKEIAVDEVHTAGKPARIVLSPEQNVIWSDRRDLAFVRVRVEDAQGRRCPNADNLVTFTLDGPGRIVGVDNGDPTSHESLQGPGHRVFHGLGLVVIRSTAYRGKIQLKAEAEGLSAATATITAD